MDRLDAQAPGRLNRAGKEGARGVELLDGDRAVEAEGVQLGREGRVIKHCPAPKPVKQAVLHLACRSLCVGQTEDVQRIHTIEQQPRNPVGQNAGLARPCVGREPC